MSKTISFIKRTKKYLKKKSRYFIRKHASEKVLEKQLVKECAERGMVFDLHRPVTYRQKMQYNKLFCATPLKTQLADKYAVREWVADKIGEEYLIPMVALYNKPEEIDFDALNEKCVLKATHGCHMNIIYDPAQPTDKRSILKTFKIWMKFNFAYGMLEMHYRDIVPRILVEKFISDSNGKLYDYKFWCFDGEPKFCWIDIDRGGDHRKNVYDMDWNLQPWTQTRKQSDHEVPCPPNYKKMAEIARTLSQGFDHVRVDLYNVDGKIYFGEMTFTNGNGFCRIIPPEYDKVLGDMWDLKIK